MEFLIRYQVAPEDAAARVTVGGEIARDFKPSANSLKWSVDWKRLKSSSFAIQARWTKDTPPSSSFSR